MKILTVICALLPGLAWAATSGEEKRFVINPLGGSDFEVIQGQNMAAAEFWCAAASYIQNRQRLAETTRIFVRNPRGPAQTVAGRSGVIFTTDPAGLPDVDNGLTLRVDAPGLNRTTAAAHRYCRDAFTRSTK